MRYELGITYLRNNEARKDLWLRCHIIFNDGTVKQLKGKKQKIKFADEKRTHKTRTSKDTGTGTH